MKKIHLNTLKLNKKRISNLTSQKQTGGSPPSDFICEYELTAATLCVPWDSCEGSQMECGGIC